MNFPWYFLLFFAAFHFWPVTLLLVAVGVGVGLKTKGVVRVLGFGVAGVLLGSALLFGAMMGLEGLKENRESAERSATADRRSETLTQPRTIGGLDFPAGTVLQWQDDEKTKVATADLPHPARLWGVIISGTVKPNEEFWTEVTLVEDSVISGWPCRAGKVELRLDGTLEQCVLSQAHAVSRLDTALRAPMLLIPAGTRLEMSPGSDSGAELTLPQDRPVKLPDVGAPLPGGAMLHLYLNNAIREVSASAEAPFTVDGVSFTSSVSWVYPEDLPEESFGPHTLAAGVSGELTQKIRCDGTLYTPDDHPYLRVYTSTSSLMFTKDVNDLPVRTAPIPLARCVIQPLAGH